jgi:hypothetical protein
MKLIYCPKCHDVRKLSHKVTFCMCGASRGWYDDDGLHATVQGEAIPLGFDNLTLRSALAMKSEGGWGKDGQGEVFEAFVIPKDCPTVTKLDN